MAFVMDLGIYLGAALVVVVLLLVFVYARVGYDWGKFKAHWATTGRGAAAGIVAFIGLLAMVSLVAFWANVASAGEWLRYTEVYAGVERTVTPSPQCQRNAVDDRLTSNGGVRQHIYSLTDRVALLGNYTHHSCAVGVDAAGYDAVGLQLNWRFERQ